MDLAVVASSNTVSVLLGIGDGTFGPKTEFGAGVNPSSVATGDLNGDGRWDLVVANRGMVGDSTGTVSVLLGNGDGTFGPKTGFRTAYFPRSVAIGDLNGDGRPDLAVASSDDYGRVGIASVLLGRGDGTFGTRTDFGTGKGPLSVAIGDLNGDGRPDLAVANAGPFTVPSSTISVLLGNGDGTFRPKTDFGTGSYPSSVAIADLNGDGWLDLAVANYFSYSVSVLLGIGNGTFGPKTDFGTDTYPSSVAIGDLNGDGQPDLVVANDLCNTVSVLLGNGDGTFGTRTDFGTESRPHFVVIGDMNGDGRPDLAVANGGSASVSVLLNLGVKTPVFLSSFALVRGDNSVQARWTLSSYARVTDFRLTASRGTEERWEIPIETQEESAFVVWDRAPQLAAGGIVRYTLLFREPGKGWVVLDEQSISLDGTPRITRLLAPYPNPANPRVVIPFMLARRQHVRVSVHDAAGREVARLDGGDLGPGAGQVVWSGEDSRGRDVASGVYVVRLVTPEGTQTRKLVVAK